MQVTDTLAAATTPAVPPRTVETLRAGSRHPPEWLWAASVAVQVVFAALLTSYTYFFVDDFLFLRQARTQAFGIHYLREPLFEHFSPVTRVLNKFIVDVAPGSFGFAHGVQLALYAAAIAALALVLRVALGRSWIALALTVLFGQSVFLMRLLTWWTATANILPATVFMLLATAGYLRWWQNKQRVWLVASLLAYVGALADYETAMLFPANLLLLRLLVLSETLDPRAWAREIWRERWAWIGYCTLDLLALINYFASYYHRMPRPSLGQVFHFVEVSLLETFTPALLGLKRVPTSSTAASVAAGLVFCALLALTLYFRPRAWRCLLAALLVFLITMIPLGLNRIRLFGVDVGAELYYQQSAQFMFLILAGFALSRRWGDERSGSAQRLRGWIPSRMLPAVALAAAVGYGVLYVSSVHALANAAWQPRDAHSYVRRFLAATERVRAATGREPNLIDLTVPSALMPADFVPFNRYSEFLPVISSKLRYDEASEPAFVVDSSGGLQRVRFSSVAVGMLLRARVTSKGQAGSVKAPVRAGGACVPPGPAVLLHVPLSAPQSVAAPTGRLPYAVRVKYALPARANVPVLIVNRGGMATADPDAHYWGPGGGAAYALLGVRMMVDEVDLVLPGGSCVHALDLGRFR